MILEPFVYSVKLFAQSLTFHACKHHLLYLFLQNNIHEMSVALNKLFLVLLSWVPINLCKIKLVCTTMFFCNCYRVLFTSQNFHSKISESRINCIYFIYYCSCTCGFIKKNLTNNIFVWQMHITMSFHEQMLEESARKS
ncbi:hypothetical protein PUN28_012793 [Cardiocondyla obscurior]|uniref:Uncharacterized protein n=1 Tax=Cardiocondyla obscurior TaxID=286306 RepID=A0AAW2FAN8_9HYME